MVVLIQLAHSSAGGRDRVVDKEEQSILWPQVNSLPDQEVELPNCKIRWDKILPLVQIRYSGFGCLLHNNLNAVS